MRGNLTKEQARQKRAAQKLCSLKGINLLTWFPPKTQSSLPTAQ